MNKKDLNKNEPYKNKKKEVDKLARRKSSRSSGRKRKSSRRRRSVWDRFF